MAVVVVVLYGAGILWEVAWLMVDGDSILWAFLVFYIGIAQQWTEGRSLTATLLGVPEYFRA